MGVAGSGKTTVAKLFAKKTGAIYYEGDDFHSPENIGRMRAGIPLTDSNREQWLQALRKIILRSLATEEFAVLTCSALKARYRDTLAAADSRIWFVHLTGPRSLIEERLNNRHGHFMSPTLLASQFDILEPPADALVFDCSRPPNEIVDELVQALGHDISV